MKWGKPYINRTAIFGCCCLLLPTFANALGIDGMTLEYVYTSGNPNADDYDEYNFNYNNVASLNLKSVDLGGTPYDLYSGNLMANIIRSNNGTKITPTYVYTTDGGTSEDYDILSNASNNGSALLTGNDMSDGIENVFSNENPSNPASQGKDIERLDFVYGEGLTTASASDVGFTFFERDGNNAFYAAAITGIDGSGAPTSFGDLVSIGSGGGYDFNYGPGLTSSSGRVKMEGGGNYPYTWGAVSLVGQEGGDIDEFDFLLEASNQPLGGVFLSFDDMNVSSGETIYGYSIFGYDNGPTSNIPTDVSDSWYNKNTTNATHGGGDIYGGGMLFYDTTAVTSDIVYWDRNGSTAGADPGTPNGLDGLWTTDSSQGNYLNWNNSDGDDNTLAWRNESVAPLVPHFSAGTDASGDEYNIELDDEMLLIGGGVWEEGTTYIGDSVDNDSNGSTSGYLHLAGSTVMEVQSGAQGIIMAPITGSSGLIKTGDGELRLTGNNTFTGLVDIQEGILAAHGGSAIDDASTVQIDTGASFYVLSDETTGPLQNGTNGGGTVYINTIPELGGPTPTLTAVFDDGEAGDADYHFSGNISGEGDFVKEGADTLTLDGESTLTGDIYVDEGDLVLDNASGEAVTQAGKIDLNGGTLTLGRSDQMGSNVALDMDTGSTFATQGHDDVLGTLTLTGSSTLDVGNGNSIINFSASNGIDWAEGETLIITNWSGNWTVGDGTDQVIFGSTMGGLTQEQVGQIFFDIDGQLYPAIILADGEVVPVPEPSTYITAIALLGLAGWHLRRRRTAKTRADAEAASKA